MHIVKPEGDPIPSGPGVPKTYNPTDFIVSPSGQNGASYRKSFRLMPDMDKAIEQVLASHKFPFTTFGDFTRWALREGLRQIDRLDPTTTVMTRVDIINAILIEENDQADFLAAFTALEQTVQKYINDQAPQQALRVIAKVRAQIEIMPDAYWRDRYLKELQDRLGKYASIATVKGIPLGPGTSQP